MEKEMATHSSILAWKSPWTEEPGGLQSMGLHDWACVLEGGGRWVGSNKVVELKKNKTKHEKQLNHLLWTLKLAPPKRTLPLVVPHAHCPTLAQVPYLWPECCPSLIAVSHRCPLKVGPQSLSWMLSRQTPGCNPLCCFLVGWSQWF